MQLINIRDVLPQYLDIFFIPSGLYLISVVITLLFVLLLILAYIKISKILNQKFSILEVKPSYKSFKSAFSTRQLFTVIHSIHKPSSFINKLIGIKKIVSCELISSKEDGIRYVLCIPTEDIALVKKALLGYLPSVEIKEISDYLPEKGNNFTIKELKLNKPYIFPLQEQTILNEFDPIAYLTAQMTKLNEEELLSVQLVCSPVSPTTHSSILSHIHVLRSTISNNEDISDKINASFLSGLVSLLSTQKKKRLSDVSISKRNTYKEVENKINQPLFEVSIRILSSSVNRNRIKGIISAFETFTSPLQSLKLNNSLIGKLLIYSKYYFFKSRQFSPASNSILSVSELASIYHFPFTGTTKTEDLVQNKSPKLPSPLSFKKAKSDLDIIFAHNTYGETTTPIGLSLEERRRHVYAIGATGSGKTTLLLSMIYNDIINGKGIAVLDPHGDLAERLLGIIPENRVQDVVYFNPYDVQHPIGLNVLEMKQGLSDSEKQREKDLITSSLISVFHKLYPARYSGPRMEHVLRNTVLTALEVESPTLFTVYKLLTNNSYRKQVVSKLIDQILKDFWQQEFEKLGSFQKAELISPITNKLGRFLTTTMTRNILNQGKSKLDLELIMNTRKILICDLSKGKIGEDTSSFLGSLLIAKIQLTALNRVHIPQEQRTDFFVYIDEFQNFATMTFAQILSEARKYRLNTILAHQTISQIEDKDLLKVILANAGTVISFRTSNPSDEDFILPLFTPQVDKNEIANLPSYNFYIKINALNPQDAFTGTTSNFIVPHSNRVRKEVIEYSKNMYGSNTESTTSIEQKNEVNESKKRSIKQSIAAKNVRVSI